MKKQIMLTAVMGLPVRDDGKMLITQRNEPEHPLAHEKWQLTGGGMEFGETPDQTLARELYEELKVSARIIFPYPMVKTWVWDFEKAYHITLITYIVDIGNQVPQIDGVENLAYKWINPEEIYHLNHLP